MNRQLKKNSSKKLKSIIGIASISALFSFPAFAFTNPAITKGNQLLAQDTPGNVNSPIPRPNTDDRSMPAGGGTPGAQPAPEAMPEAAPEAAPQAAPRGTDTPRTVPSLPPEKTTTGEKLEPVSDTSLQPGSWFCMNNPNPQCRG